MKLLFYNHTGQVSGAERVLLSVLGGVARSSQASVVLCCPADSPLSEAAGRVVVCVEPVEEWRARFTWRPDRLLGYLWSFCRVARAFRAQAVKIKPDLIHANSVRAGLVAAAATAGLRVPVVWHVHDVLPRHPLSVAIRWFALASPRTRLLAVSRAAARKFESRPLKWLARRRAPAVIHNGVDADRFRPDPASRAAARRELWLDETDFVLGTIGQITPRKGQLELIRALAKVAEQVPQVRLLVVGAPLFGHDHRYFARLRRTIEELGLAERVRFLGARGDVAALMRALDLAVVNSRSDPFPLALLEALASGTPVVATAVDGIPELISHGETGWLVPPRDPDALAAGIAALIRDPALRARLAARGRKRVESGFTSAHFLRAMESYLREACSVPPGVESGRVSRETAAG
jgi:L-malate glycosyltransferase